ncbi:hypothetical protein WBG06_07185 [Nocardioides sp. CCNWLW239]|uniref:hypothetical protein n=1 Tax=Nocardioides sp. CCNWLW239 TaxID=3128902 RepID=UPI0030173E53
MSMALLSVTLLPMLFAAPASADSVTPVRHCSHGDGYREVDGDSSVSVTAPDGYLIVAYCVDSRGRRGTSEVHVLSAPQRTVLIRHSDGRSLEGYSVAYSRVDAPDEPEDGPDGDDEDDQNEPGEQNEQGDNGGRDDNDDRGGRDEASQTPEAEPGQGAPAKNEHKNGAGKAEKREKAEGTPSASASAAQPEPSRQPSATVSAQPDGSLQMSALSDGEELRTTALAEKDDDDEEGLRSLVVAGGIIILGLLAGMIALLVRLPGQR